MEREGDVLGPYALERCLGEGAMGRVWLAKHVKLGRHAAIKVLKAEHVQRSDLVSRFFDEARAVNQINHEHIVAISDFVEELEPQRVYCIMEYLPGESLDRRVAREPLPLPEALSVMRQVCDALSAAHRLSIVHRDIKPDNIFLSIKADGSLFAKVLDFGVAKLTPAMKRDAVTTTQQGQLIGTPAYMAPEQLVGLEVDATADVYSVGTVLYRLLAGHLPFQETDFGRLSMQVIKEPPPPLPKKTPRGEPIDRALARVVMRALAKEPPDRPTIESLLAALDAALKGPEKKAGVPVSTLLLSAALAASVGLWFVTTRPAPPPLPGPATAAAELTGPITLTVRTEPPGAKVSRADTGELLGSTPLTHELTRGAPPVPLRISLEGYLDVERTTQATRDTVIDVMLAAKPKAPPPGSETVRPDRKKTKMRISDEGTLDPFN